MSEISYSSKIKTVNAPAATVYPVLSDLSRYDGMYDRLPAEAKEKVKDIHCTTDSISLTVDPVGDIKFEIIDREPNKNIKFGLAGAPIQANFWIQLVEKEDRPGVCFMKLTLKADLPLMIKMMLGKKLDKAPEALDQLADGLAHMFG